MSEQNREDRDEYLEYLMHVQPDASEPLETYTDWSGETVLSFSDWLKQKRATSLSEK